MSVTAVHCAFSTRKIFLIVLQPPVLLREVSYGCTLSPSCRVLNLLKLTSTWLYLHMPMHEGTASYVLRIFLFVYDHSWRLM